MVKLFIGSAPPRLRDFVCAGFFLVKPVNLQSPSEHLDKVVTASTYVSSTLPDTWAFSWVMMEESERETAASAWGFNEEDAKRFIDWVTEQMYAENIGWPNVLMSINVATNLLDIFNTEEVRTARLVGLGLHKEMVSAFLDKSGFNKDAFGRVGIVKCLSRNKQLPKGKRILGYDILSLDISGDLDSWLRYLLNHSSEKRRKIRSNSHGLINSYSDARERMCNTLLLIR